MVEHGTRPYDPRMKRSFVVRAGFGVALVACAAKTAVIATTEDGGAESDASSDLAEHDANPRSDSSVPQDDASANGDAALADGDAAADAGGWFDSDDGILCIGTSGSLDETWADAGVLAGLKVPLQPDLPDWPAPTGLVAVDHADRAYIATAFDVGGWVSLAVRRLLSNGAEDPTFMLTKVLLPQCVPNTCPPGTSVRTLVVRSQGVLVGGHSIGTGELARDFLMVAVGPDGGLMPEFDGGTMGKIDFGAHRDEHATFGAPAADGRIVLVGTQEPHIQKSPGLADRRLAVTRILPDGTVDPTFGRATFDAGMNAEAPVATVVGGRTFILVRVFELPSRVMRLETDGGLIGATEVPAATYQGGVAGASVWTLDSRAGITVDPKGRVVVSDGPISRVLPDGTLDPTFGDGGTVTLPESSAVVFLSDALSRTLVWTERGTVRLLENGSVDSTYAPRAVPSVPVGRNAYAKGCRVISATGQIRKYRL